MLAGASTDDIRALLDSLGTSAFLVNVVPGGGFAYAWLNRRYEALSGLSAAAVIGRSPLEVLPAAAAVLAGAAFRRCIAECQPASYEEPDGGAGSADWRETTVVPVLDAAGRVVRLLGQVVDISARKLAEERLDLMLHNVPALISYIDKDQRYQFANRAVTEWLQRPRTEVLGRRPSELAASGDLAAAQPLFEALLGRGSTAEAEVDWPGLGRRAVQTAYIPDRVADQPVRGVQVMTTDVTEQRRAEAALRETEANLRAVFNAAADPILLLDIDGTVLASNDAAARRFSATPDALIGHKVWEFAPESRRPQIAAEIAYAVQCRTPVWSDTEEDKQAFEEVTYPVFDNDGHVVRLAGCARDITSKKHIENILHRRDAILEAVAFSAGRFLSAASWEDCISEVLERLGRAAQVSRAYIFENRTGPNDTLVMSQYCEWTAPGVVPQIDNPVFQTLPYRAGGFARWEELLRAGKPAIDFLEWLPRTAAGDLAPQGVRSIVAVPLMVGDTWWGFIGFEDRNPDRVWEKAEIDALRTAAATLGAAFRRQEIDQALHESEARYQLAISAGTVGIWDWHIDGDTVLGTADFPRKLGHGDAESATTLEDWLRLVHPDDRPSVSAALKDYVEGRADHYEREFRLMQTDGSFRWFIGRGAIVVRDRSGRPIRMAGTLTDITELKRTENALWRRTEDLAVANDELKSFTHIVSHDLRSPLITIKGFTSELRTIRQELIAALAPLLHGPDSAQFGLARSLLEDQAAKALGYISNAADKMESQLAAILQLSRLGRREPGHGLIDVDDVVARVLQGLSFQIEKAQARVMVAALPRVWADREALDLVFSNVLSNAVNYLRPGRPGLIEVWAEVDELRTVFKVRDNGRGIAKNDLPKIFDIFRRVGLAEVAGEGVGLTFARAAARRCGGDLWAESEAGVGSTFSFSIPNMPIAQARAGMAP